MASCPKNVAAPGVDDQLLEQTFSMNMTIVIPLVHYWTTISFQTICYSNLKSEHLFKENQKPVYFFLTI